MVRITTDNPSDAEPENELRRSTMKAPIRKILNEEPITGQELLEAADHLSLLVLYRDEIAQLGLVDGGMDIGNNVLDEANHMYRRIYRLECDCYPVMQQTAD